MKSWHLILAFYLFTFPIFGEMAPTKLWYPMIKNKIEDKYESSKYEALQGLLGERININLDKRLLKIDSAIILSGFKHRPGSQTWLGEHVGKFLNSAANTYKYSKDARLKQLMDDVVTKYIATQLPDGYIGTYLPKDYWTEWDVWAHKYCIIGLLSYYSVTGSKPALQTAMNAADLICRTFGDKPGQKDLMASGHHTGMASGSILEPMVDLYRYTGKQEYLDFCSYIIRAFEQENGPKIISNLQEYGAVNKVGNAKAYEMLSCFVGILKYYKLTGEEKYLKAMKAAWKDIRLNRLYITGTTSSHELFKETDILPAEPENHMGEGCVTTTWIQFNLQLLQITGEAKYVDEIERSVYNHLFAAENPKTGCVSYYTPLQGIKPHKCDQGFSCCLSSVPRAISLIPDMVYGKVNSIFSVLLYEGGEVLDTISLDNGTKTGVQITAVTGFPLDSSIKYIVNPSLEAKFPIAFRVPAWSKKFIAKVNGLEYKGTTGCFLIIDREWKRNDEITISFQMPVQLISGNISYPKAIAIKKGAQVLAMDESLNLSNTNLEKSLFNPLKTLSLSEAKKPLPGAWNRKEAYNLTSLTQGINVVLVPFAESGQLGDFTYVWLPVSKMYFRNP